MATITGGATARPRSIFLGGQTITGEVVFPGQASKKAAIYVNLRLLAILISDF